MRGLKASLVSIIAAITACIVMILVSGISFDGGLKKTDIQVSGTGVSDGIVKGEGSFSADINYESGDDMGIYYVKYDDRNSVKLYNISTGKSDTVLTPMDAKNKIHAFCKSGDYYAWEEDCILQDDQEEPESWSNWKLYIRRGNQIVRIDEGRSFNIKTDVNLKLPPQKLTASENYLVYKTYDMLPDTESPGIVIKLYDMKNDKCSVIYSAADFKNTQVSEPYIYKNHIVWSVSKGENRGDMYLYNTGSGSTSKLTENGALSNPIIWGDYIICSSAGSSAPAITVLNFNTGFKKNIAFSDYTLFPKKEMHDYSADGGYVTWNSSYADTVSVYDIINDRLYQLKMSSPSGNEENSLLNVRIYGKMLVFMDHRFDNRNGSTISEVNRYINLK